MDEEEEQYRALEAVNRVREIMGWDAVMLEELDAVRTLANTVMAENDRLKAGLARYLDWANWEPQDATKRAVTWRGSFDGRQFARDALGRSDPLPEPDSDH